MPFLVTLNKNMGANDEVKYMIIGFFPDPERTTGFLYNNKNKMEDVDLIKKENIAWKTIIATLPQMKISYINTNMIHGFSLSFPCFFETIGSSLTLCNCFHSTNFTFMFYFAQGYIFCSVF